VRRAGIFWALCLLPAFALGQRAYHLTDYLRSQVGDTLQLRYAQPQRLADQPMVLTFDTLPGGLQQRLLGGQPSQTYRLDSLHGWVLLSLGSAQGRQVVLDEPLRLLPPAVTVGEDYAVQGTYALYERGRPAGKGTIACWVQVHGASASRTYLRNFDDCLVLLTTIEWRLPDGAAEGFELKEWHARGLGLVKASGKEFRKSKTGAILATEHLAAMLERAFVHGAWLD
jgi:hypothetical protein